MTESAAEHYRLVFRGEVLDGQHPAVVRRRLAQVGDFDDAALEKLFSGRPVVLKREADTATAARLQALFRKAGARLRVLPVESAAPSAVSTPESRGPTPGRQAPDRAAAAVAGGPELLPAGSDVLRAEERTPWVPRDIDTGSLTLETAPFPAPERPTPPAPDVSHLALAAVGSRLGTSRPSEMHQVEVPDLDLAPPGSDLAPAAAPAEPPVDFATLSYEIAPPGADLGQRKAPPPPEAPDTSHLNLAD